MAKRILVVEDEELLRQLIASVLEHSGYDVLQAEDGIAAVSALIDEEVDGVLLDLIMPRMKGFDVIHQLRTAARGDGLPIIVLSSLQGEAPQLAMDLGADAFLPKPLDQQALIDTVKQLIG